MCGVAALVAVGGCSGDEEAAVSTTESPASLFDLTKGDGPIEAATYVPKVEQVDVLDFDLATPNGVRLYVHGVYTAKLRYEVTAEPFRTEFTYGVTSADGTSCAIGTFNATHGDVYFDQAARANAAAEAVKLPAPSLAPCERGGSCDAEGEECIGFYEAPPVSEAQAKAEEVPEPREVWQCMSTAWALETVSDRTTQPVLVTPADLAGGESQGVYEVETAAMVPIECEAMVGKKDLTLWIAFDVKGSTAFAQRPATAKGGDPEDPEVLSSDPNTHRLTAYDAPFAMAVAGTDQVNLDFIDMNISSSVITYLDHDHTGADVTLNARMAQSGHNPASPFEDGFGNLVTFAGKIAPLSFAEGCADRPADAVAKEDVEFAWETDQGVSVEPVYGELVFDPQSVMNRALPVHLTDAFRERVFRGDWRCAERFEIEMCMNSLLTFYEDSPPCRKVELSIIRDEYEGGGTPLPETPPGGQAKNLQGCNEGLLKEYQEWSRKQQEAENLAQIQNYYVLDINNFNEKEAYYHPFQNSDYWRDYFRDWGTRSQSWPRMRVCHQKTLESDPGANVINKGHSECLGVNQSVIDRWSYDYVVAYLFQRVVGQRNDPVKYTKEQFAYACGGITGGGVCSTIGNDPNRVGEIKNKILSLMQSNDTSDSWNDKISTNGRHRCLTMLRALSRVNYTMNDYNSEIYQTVGDDGAFYDKYLTARCSASYFAAERQKVWNQIQSSCAASPTENVNNGSGYYGEKRLVSKWVKEIGTGGQNALELKFRAGLINDARLRPKGGWDNADIKFTFGPEVRLWLDIHTGDWRTMFQLHDMYRWNMQAEFYATDGGKTNKATWMDAGQHVLLRDIYRIRFPMPPVPSVEWPEPPGFSKEYERCQYLRPGASPVSLELCAGMIGKAEITIGAKVLANGVKAENENEDDNAKATWPGVEGKVEPGYGAAAVARVGVDFLAGSVGVKVEVDIIKVGYPLAIGTRWTMKPQSGRLEYKINPYITFSREMSTLSGSISAYLRLRFPKKEWSQKLYEWNGFKDTLEIFKYEHFEKGSHSL